jgi:hypothetical protein
MLRGHLRLGTCVLRRQGGAQCDARLVQPEPILLASIFTPMWVSAGRAAYASAPRVCAEAR